MPWCAEVCRDTAAEAAGTGGVGTAGALAKKLSSPMSHITEEDDLNVVQVDNEIRERSPANYFSAPDLLQNRAEKRRRQVDTTITYLGSKKRLIESVSDIHCFLLSLCICDS